MKEFKACLCAFPSRQSISDYSGVMSLHCTLSEDKLHGETEKWVLHVGNCTLVTVMQHLFKEIISADSNHNQYTFTKQLSDTLFMYNSKCSSSLSRTQLLLYVWCNPVTVIQECCQYVLVLFTANRVAYKSYLMGDFRNSEQCIITFT